MKEKLLSVGKFVIIKHIFNMTDIFDLGFLLVFLDMHQTGMWVWVVSMHSRSFYSYQWDINFVLPDLLTSGWSHMGKCHFCASFICDVMVTFETAA